ncbi:unnamed protein product [Sphenostylis stenocarpa]|uniref:Calponin-homology (CH) domain-containing protein n=1 Tax=Sphenostylis stenocarpa TaxID=92480 RepID=A0AA86SIU2_9FABA|nr:unnamed protein product [Sphenostylis stenocarpa]
MDCDEPPSPYPHSSSLLKDISNFTTPRRPPFSLTTARSPTTQFFTASKHSSTFNRRPKKSSTAATSKKLKAFQSELSQSSRKAQIQKERSLRSLAKSLSVWLNFLLQNPDSCGCHFSTADASVPATNGKRDGTPGISVVGVDSTWRTPKRQRKTWSAKENAATGVEVPDSSFSHLSDSLKDICSFDDLKQRMRVYFSLTACKEIFLQMNRVAKTIDEGRLIMKAHCPIVTDVGLKDKAMRILMCYNSIWLRIGIMVVDKLFFSHEGLAKAHAYNKMVEGVYRSGYYENLGNVILKRILLLVLILDKAKCQSYLPLEYGIDGLDGGSPLLFKPESWIKSSSQLIHGYKLSHQQEPLVEYDFRIRDLFVDLQDGLKLCRAIQLLQHNSSILMKIVVPSDTPKKKLSNCGLALQYIRQAGGSLLDEDGITIVADDIANGDKELTLSLLWNMFVHLQVLPLLVDQTSLVGEISKIRGGMGLVNNANSTSMELLLNWIQAVCDNYDCLIDNFHSLVDGKAIWCLLDYYFQKELHNSCSLKEVSMKSGKASIMSVDEYSDALYNFILSQKLTTLLGNFPEVLHISELLQYNGACSDRSVVILLVFLASQLFVKKNLDHLNFRKLLCHDCQSPNHRHLRMLRCLSNSDSIQKHHASDVHGNEDAARKFKAIQAWWQDMAERNGLNKPAVSNLQGSRTTECNINNKRENAARTIQLHFRGLVVRWKFLKMVNAVTLLQTVFRAWLKVRQESVCVILSTVQVCDSSYEILKQSQTYPEILKQSQTYKRYAMLFIHRRSFLRLKSSAQIIQKAVRSWLYRRHQHECSTSHVLLITDMVAAAINVQKFVRACLEKVHVPQLFKIEFKASVVIQSFFRGWLARKDAYARRTHFTEFKAAVVIQSSLRGWFARKDACARRNHIIEIQKHCRGWLVKRYFLFQRDHVVKIQCVIRSLKCQKALNCQKDVALEIQRFIRGHLTRNQLLGSAFKLRTVTTSCSSRPFGICSSQLQMFLLSVVKLQRWWKGLLLLKLMNKSAIIIQSWTRGWIARRNASVYRRHVVIQEDAALVIQRYIRGHLTRNRILGGASNLSAVVPAGCISELVGCRSFPLDLVLLSAVKLQRWWKGLLLEKLMTKSAIVIQSCTRGWIARRKASVQRHNIIVIQSHWKGYLARKESKEQLLDLRLRMQKSARNVDDSKRLINRLLAALSELLNMKSLSNILHTCSILGEIFFYIA